MNSNSHPASTWILAGILLLGACSHDTKRTNPLDPVLTPPVELEVAVDDTAGSATLKWTQYAGERGPSRSTAYCARSRGWKPWTRLT